LFMALDNWEQRKINESNHMDKIWPTRSTPTSGGTKNNSQGQ